MNTKNTRIWTVVHVDDGEALPWNTSYTNRDAAIAAVQEEYAAIVEEWDSEEDHELAFCSHGHTQEDQVRLEDEDNSTYWLVTPTTRG